MQPLIIIKAGDTFADTAMTYGDFEHWINAGMGDTALPIRIIDPRHGDKLPNAGDIAGVIVTGSHAMVTERQDWSEMTAAWLADLVGRNVPILGICYGHQLLAHALGGKVRNHPDGMEIGTVEVRQTEAGKNDRLFSDLPPFFSAQTVHKQSVLHLPDHAVLLAANEFEPHHAFRIGESAWGVQFHPEFSSSVMRSYIAHLAEDIAAQGNDAKRRSEQVTDTHSAATLLKGFAAFVQNRQAYQ